MPAETDPIIPSFQPAPPPPPYTALSWEPSPKPSHRTLKRVLLIGLFGAMTGGLVALGLSYQQVTHHEALQRRTIAAQKRSLAQDSATLKLDHTVIMGDSKAIRDNYNQIDQLYSELHAQSEVPPGGYAQFQTQLENGLNSQYGVTVGSVNCILPSSWTPGDQFSCDVFDPNGSALGTATVTIESPNPGQVASWEYTWTPSGS